MKKLFTLLFISILVFNNARAQTIISMTVNPPAPTVNDNIEFIAECQFPSGGCDDKTLSNSGSGNELYLSAMHCVGMATFICTSMDTFNLGQLPAGTYTVYFNLNMGQGPSPCTPGIVPGPTDSMTFTVTTTTGLPQVNAAAIRLLPNPGKSGCKLEFDGNAATLVEVSDMSGRVVMKIPAFHSGEYLDFSQLQSGTYLVALYEGDTLLARQKWVKEK